MKVNKKFTIMPFASPIQEAIFEALAFGPTTGPELLKHVSEKCSVTKQGLHKTMRELVQKKVVIKEQKYFSFNKTWLVYLRSFIEESERTLGSALPFSDTSSSNRKSLTFKDAGTLNIYWGHLFLTLAHTYAGKPFFFFNHHSWSIYDDPELETYLYQESLKNNYPILITLGTDTPLAREFKRTYQSPTIQIAINEKLSIPKTDHVCVVGEYVITTRYDRQTMLKIDNLFKQKVEFGETERKELRTILNNCKSPKIIIVKNNKKALTWKRRFAKSFVIKKSEL